MGFLKSKFHNLASMAAEERCASATHCSQSALQMREEGDVLCTETCVTYTLEQP